VRWADGSRLPIILDPGEGRFDEDGYLRLFSLSFPDGGVGNYVLLPRDQSTDVVLRVTKEILLPLGMRLVGEAISSAEGIVANFAEFLFETFGPSAELTIRDYLERVRVESSAYYNMEKGWCVIEQPLRQ
jgi:hypothetical protein